MQMNLRGTINNSFTKDLNLESKPSPDKIKSDNLAQNIKKNETSKELQQSIKEVSYYF